MNEHDENVEKEISTNQTEPVETPMEDLPIAGINEAGDSAASEPWVITPPVENSNDGYLSPIGTPATPKTPRNKMGAGKALLIGIIIGILMVSSMWYYLHANTYNYEVRRNTSEFAKPRDIQEVLAKVEPATVAVTINGGTGKGGAAGTGFIISSDGLVVTNNHVVEGGQNTILVTLNDGRALPAKLLGTDPLNDLAVLKMDGNDFPAATLGSSDKTEVGDDVIAIGNALALEGGLSVTRGIVSGKDRTIDTELGTKLEGILQTDAAINRGNSGGPLVNSKGEVIGINTAIADPGYAQNVGFAIAIDRAKPIIADLKEGKTRKIAYIGIAAQDVSPRLVAELKLKEETGALIVQIVKDSPASKSDLALNDVILEIDGKKIESSADMVAQIRSKQPGDKVKIKLDRRGKEKTVEVTLVERPV